MTSKKIAINIQDIKVTSNDKLVMFRYEIREGEKSIYKHEEVRGEGNLQEATEV